MKNKKPRILTSTDRLTVRGVCRPLSEFKRPITRKISIVIPLPPFLFFLYPTKECFESLHEKPYQSDDACYHNITSVDYTRWGALKSTVR